MATAPFPAGGGDGVVGISAKLAKLAAVKTPATCTYCLRDGGGGLQVCQVCGDALAHAPCCTEMVGRLFVGQAEAVLCVCRPCALARSAALAEERQERRDEVTSALLGLVSEVSLVRRLRAAQRSGEGGAPTAEGLLKRLRSSLTTLTHLKPRDQSCPVLAASRSFGQALGHLRAVQLLDCDTAPVPQARVKELRSREFLRQGASGAMDVLANEEPPHHHSAARCVGKCVAAHLADLQAAATVEQAVCAGSWRLDSR